MDIYVYNTSFQKIALIDNYTSLLWVQRYSRYGDFELIVPASTDIMTILAQEYFLHIPYFDDIWMVIESVKLVTDSESGDTYSVTGRSIESILDRRIIFPQTTISGGVQQCVKSLIESNIGSSASANRRISNFAVQESSDTNITSLQGLKAQFTGTNLYDAVVDICETYGLGFKVTFSENVFTFTLICGTDRSASQQTVPKIIFSKDYDSLLDSVYKNGCEQFKNVAYINGVGEGTDRKHAIFDPVSSTGISRRELYVDARDISNVDGETEIPDSEYEQLLVERGAEKILEHLPEQYFEATPVPDNQFHFGSDYFLGDIVTVVNDYGMSANARVTEMIFSDDETGMSYYPTFELIV